jgi:hypothetical protein
MKIPLEDFRVGLDVELEHGTRFKDANVTNNHPLLTGKIVLAHLKETMDYIIRELSGRGGRGFAQGDIDPGIYLKLPSSIKSLWLHRTS